MSLPLLWRLLLLARPRRRVGGLALAMGLFSVVIVGALWVSLFLLSAYERQSEIADVMRHNANLARSFVEHTVRTLAYVDELTLVIKRQFEVQGAAFDLARFLEDMQINPAVVHNVVITDAQGMVILGSHGAPPISLADREHIQVHLQEDTQRLFLGKPVLGRVHGKWAVPATRRANAADGTVLGVISVALDPFYFSNFYKELDLGTNGTVALVGFDGIVRSRLANAGQGIGTSLARSELFRQFAAAPHGTYLATSVIDGITRIHAYRALEDYPLLVSVGVEQQHALADVTQRLRGYRILASLASLIILASAAVLMLFAVRRRQAEDRTRQMNQHLQEQTAELKAVNHELSAFAYAVSHDLRAPLRAIHGYSQLLAEEYGAQLTDHGARYLTVVRSEARRMGILIHELLKLSRVTRATLTYEAVDLSQLVTRQLATLHQREPARVVEAEVTPDIRVRGDRELLEIALESLVENAWKFTTKRPVAQITFGVEQRDGVQVYVLRDNGVGFDTRYTEKLFTAFHRLHGAEYDGAGVGLATVSRVIQRHRGRIWAESKVEQGAAFFFVLGVS